MPRRKAPAPSSESSDAEDIASSRQNDDSDGETPQKSDKTSGRSKPKRRPSAPFADASNNDFTVPLKDDSGAQSRSSLQKHASGFTEVDDRAEKRKRRRSTRVSFAGQPDETLDGNASNGAAESDPLAGGSAQELSRSTASRPSMRTARLSSGNSLRINAVAPAPAPAISMDVMNTNFEEWMKMATDNVSVCISLYTDSN